MTPKQGVVEAIRKADGWDALDLEDRKGLSKQDQRVLREHCELVHRVFGTEDGERLLQHLLSQYVVRPIVNANDTPFGAGIREGQASVVRALLTDIECAKQGAFGGE